MAGVLLTLALAISAAAQQPIAVLSFAGTDRMTEDLEMLTGLSGSPKLATQTLEWLSRMTGIARLDGMDTTRPLGAVIESDGLVVSPVAFFPVDDADALLASISNAFGPAELHDKDIWKVGLGDFSGFAREQDGWMFFAQDPAALTNLPNPESVLGDLPTEYDAALRMNLQRIPDVFRQFLVDLLRTLLRADLPQRPDESAAVHNLRSSWLRFEFDMFERMITESEEITLGYTIDAAKRRAELNVHFRPLPETSLAKALRNLHQAKTRFAALVDDESGVVAHATLSMGQHEIERATAHLQGLRGPVLEVINATQMIQSDADREMLGRLVGTLFDTAQATINSGRLDMAVLGRGESSPVTVLAAAHVGSSKNLRQLMERISQAHDTGGLWQLKMDVAEIPTASAGTNGAAAEPIHVHALEFDADNASVLKRLFGADARLYLALGNDVVWMGIGPDTLAGLERIARGEHAVANGNADDESAARLPPVSLNLKLGEIAGVAAQASDNFLWRFWMGSIAQGLKSADDTLLFELEADQEELHARLAMEEGVLRAVATALALRLANETPAESAAQK